MRDEKWFWKVIDRSRAGGLLEYIAKIKLPHHRQVRNLESILLQLPPGEIKDFATIFEHLLRKSYTWKLWGAAYVINGGCSDDTFDYFRSWLIGRGEKVFYNALNDPETLTTVLSRAEARDMEWEGLEYCANDAFEEITGNTLVFPDGSRHQSEPEGNPWTEDQLPSMFPKLWKKFGDEHQ